MTESPFTIARRWLGIVLACISLLLCLTSACIWTFFSSELFGVRIYSLNQRLVITCFEGKAHFHLAGASPSDDASRTWNFFRAGVSGQRIQLANIKIPEVRYQYWGFGYGESRSDTISRQAWLRDTVRRNPLLSPYDPRIAAVRSPPAILQLPLWFCAMIFAILPAIHIARYVRDRRRSITGRCAQCGYDLRATPERCPECGAVVPVTKPVEANPQTPAGDGI